MYLTTDISIHRTDYVECENNIYYDRQKTDRPRYREMCKNRRNRLNRKSIVKLVICFQRILVSIVIQRSLLLQSTSERNFDVFLYIFFLRELLSPEATSHNLAITYISRTVDNV